MMSILRLVPFLLLVACSLAVAQSPDPRDILRASAESLATVKTISYHGVLVQKFLTRQTTDTMVGDVWFSRNVADHEVGGRARLEPGDTAWHGTYMAYDGEVTAIVSPEKRKVTLADSTIGGHEYILSNLNANLILKALRNEPFEDLLVDTLKARYEGSEAVEGIPCRAVRVDMPDDGDATEQYARWWIGTDDGIPRRYFEHVVYKGMLQTRELTLYDVRIDPELSDTLFSPPVPDGFTVEHYNPQRDVRERPKPLPDGVAAPAWTLAAPSGDSVSLADLRGRVVVLDFWGTWCLPCIMAMPTLQKIHENYAARNVSVYGIDCQDRRGDPVGMMKEKGITYGLLLNGDSVAATYHVPAFPTIYVIGPNGEIVGHVEGYDPDPGTAYDELSALVERGLGGEKR